MRLFELYTKPNKYLLDYMKKEEFDYHAYWWEICKIIYENDYILEEFNEKININNKNIDDSSDINENFEPEDFMKFDKDTQKVIEKKVYNYLEQYSPEDLPTYKHASISTEKLLPRNTWLIHFTDEPQSIKDNGFKYGIEDINKLGLTTYFNKEYKKDGGYNFAFIPISRDAINAQQGSRPKYGKHAVMFQNSGIEVFHRGDLERQIIFNGSDVKPNDIIVLKSNCDEGDWCVKAQYGKKDYVFSGDFEDVVNWVIKNHTQYKNIIY